MIEIILMIAIIILVITLASKKTDNLGQATSLIITLVMIVLLSGILPEVVNFMTNSTINESLPEEKEDTFKYPPESKERIIRPPTFIGFMIIFFIGLYFGLNRFLKGMGRRIKENYENAK